MTIDPDRIEWMQLVTLPNFRQSSGRARVSAFSGGEMPSPRCMPANSNPGTQSAGAAANAESSNPAAADASGGLIFVQLPRFTVTAARSFPIASRRRTPSGCLAPPVYCARMRMLERDRGEEFEGMRLRQIAEREYQVVR